MALITNSMPEDFGDVQGAGGVTITHASVIYNFERVSDVTYPDPWDRQFLLWTGTVANSRALSQDDEMIFPAGSIDITLPAGALENVGIQRLMQAAHGDLITPTVLLGTGDMGANGTSNEVSDAGYTRQDCEITITA